MIWIVFALGVANFYFHRAMMEGEGPVLGELADTLKRFGGGYGSYILEFLFLVAALWFASSGSTLIIAFYGAYTAMNIVGYIVLRQMGER